MAKIFVCGETLDAEFLGDGSFSDVYARGNEVFIFTRKVDKSKLALCGLEGPHIPKMQMIEEQKSCLVFKSEVYRDITHTHPLMEYFIDLRSLAYKSISNVKRSDAMVEEDVNFWAHVLQDMWKRYKAFKVHEILLRDFDAIIQSASRLSNRISLDMIDRNAAIDTQGNLILRDIIGAL